MRGELDKALQSTIVNDEAINLAKDYLEVGLDSVLNGGLIKEIPVFSTLVSLYKVGNSLKERHMFKKLAAFLNRLSEISIEDRNKFVQKLSYSVNYGESVSEKILLIIDRLDEIKKAEIIGNLFKLYVLGVYNRDRFLRLSGIVEKSFVYDLEGLYRSHSDFRPSNTSTFPMDAYNIQALLSLGVFAQTIDNSKTGGPVRYGLNPPVDIMLTTAVTQLGKDLANYMFCDLNDPKFIQHMNELRNR